MPGTRKYSAASHCAVCVTCESVAQLPPLLSFDFLPKEGNFLIKTNDYSDDYLFSE